MEAVDAVRLYVAGDAIEACVDSLRGKIAITISGLDQDGTAVQVTGIVLSLVLGDSHFRTHSTLVTIAPTPAWC
jgi:hypothetical protein